MSGSSLACRRLRGFSVGCREADPASKIRCLGHDVLEGLDAALSLIVIEAADLQPLRSVRNAGDSAKGATGEERLEAAVRFAGAGSCTAGQMLPLAGDSFRMRHVSIALGLHR
jgi:hypothetical protein